MFLGENAVFLYFLSIGAGNFIILHTDYFCSRIKKIQKEHNMTTPILFREYIWLVNTINQARNITLEEINRKC